LIALPIYSALLKANEPEMPLFQPISILNQQREVILYGAGNIGRQAHAILTQHGWTVRCFLDQNAQPNTHWQGVPILRPTNDILTLGEHRLPVIITIFNRDVNIPAVAARLTELGYIACISFVDFHARFAAELGDRFWLVDRGFYSTPHEDMDRAQQLWADEISQEIYRGTIAFRQTGEYDQLPVPQPDHVQYFPADIAGWPPALPLRFVDCGAYDGDTLAALVQLSYPVEAVAGFEPDLVNFQRLADRARHFQPMPRDGITLWPCGVAARTEMFSFATGQGEGSRLSQEGGAVIQCVALDDVLSGFRPNLIKMDIEGAEPDALYGARQLIAAHRPALAISVYHRPEHLWQIPLLLAQWNSRYRFYLRAHGYDGFDTILYAVS
jgi:FkbM family methyltransferase